MMKNGILLTLLSFWALLSCAQQKTQNYDGEWIGHLPNRNSFNFEVSLEKLENNTYHLTLANDTILIDKIITTTSEDFVRFSIDEQLFFNLTYDENRQALTGNIKTGKFYYYVTLTDNGQNTFVGAWNPFMLDNGLQSDDVMLYVENTEGDHLVAYPFFGDQRFRGTWASGFKKNENTLTFKDLNTGFKYRAKLLEATIELEILLTDVFITKTSLTHTNDGWDYNKDQVDEPAV